MRKSLATLVLVLGGAAVATSGCTTCFTYPDDNGDGNVTVECRNDPWPTTIP